MASGKVHYAWIVLVGCCSLTAGMGLLLNTGGQWFMVVTEELGVSVSQLSLYFTVQGLCMAATAPFVGKILPKANTRLLLTGCYTVCILAVAAMSQFTEVWQWYIAGGVLGVAGCFVFLIPGPIIIGNWFVKKAGFAIGIAMCFSGVAAAIWNPVVAALIASVGWRMAYLITAAVTAVVVLPCTLFLIKFKPADKGMHPYGYEEAACGASVAAGMDASGVAAKVAYKSIPFWMLFLACGLFAFMSCYAQALPTYMTSINMISIVGLISTACMLGNIAGKLGLGQVADKLGGTASALIGLALVAGGLLLMVFCGANTGMALAGALFYGIAMSLQAVVIPLLIRAAFGSKDFASLYSTANVAASLIGAFGLTAISLIFDLNGSYSPALWLGVGLCAVIALLVVLGVGMAKKLPRES